MEKENLAFRPDRQAAAAISDKWPGQHPPLIIFYEVIDSTNDCAKRLLCAGTKPPFVIIAGRQTKGRGRRGRSFFSPEEGVYLTSVKTPDDEEKNEILQTPGITTCRAAVQAAEAIEAVFSVQTGIKWINDLILGGKKVGGILTETTGPPAALVIGVGINISTKTFPPELSGSAGALLPASPPRSVVYQFCAELGSRLLERIPAKDVIAAYKERLTLTGQKVILTGGAHDGEDVLVLGIAPDAGLIVETIDGRVLTVYDGETRLFSV
jgi:BirA family biotin operon repressor/biotin-[acetyl-CoA-carboxylase] ligase